MMQIYENLSLTDIDGECWLPLFGYETHFQISNMGRIKKLSYISKDRIGNPLHKPVRIIKGTRRPKGYVKTRLYLNPKSFKPFQIHRLVCRTFHGPAPKGMDQVNHINGIKWDNRSVNVEWSNNSLNITHAWANGLHKPKIPSGINCSKAVIVAHKEYGIFTTIIYAAKEMGINRSRLSKMVRGVIPNNSKYILS